VGEGGPGVAAGNIVTALSAVPGVADAEIAPDGRPGGAGTLRLTLEPGSDEVAVAAAVNRVLRERFGLAVDSDRVAVVDESTLRRPRRSAPDVRTAWETGKGRQDEGGSAEGEAMSTDTGTGLGAGIGPGMGSALNVDAGSGMGGGSPLGAGQDSDADAGLREITLPSARGSRLLIERLQLTSADLTVDAEVTLAFHGETFVGRFQAGATPTSIHRAVAQATLRAVERCIGNEARFELEHLEVPAMGSERAVLVEISMVTRRGTERFTGVSAVRDDVRAAVVRASLAALNRRLESFLVPA
jgi:hypothetical protein